MKTKINQNKLKNSTQRLDFSLLSEAKRESFASSDVKVAAPYEIWMDAEGAIGFKKLR